jgi:hypothetical protein
MAVQHVSPRLANSSAVHGLEGGRERARRRASRRRLQSTLVSGVMFLVVAGVLGGAGYYLWQFYADEQERNTTDGPARVEQRDPNEVIDELEDNPRWNGPGNPTFGVGDEQP